MGPPDGIPSALAYYLIPCITESVTAWGSMLYGAYGVYPPCPLKISGGLIFPSIVKAPSKSACTSETPF